MEREDILTPPALVANKAGRAAAPQEGPSPKQTLAARLFSFPVLLAFGLVVVTALTVSNRFADPDIWWHLKLGQTIWTTKSIPATDLFSYTVAGKPWTAHEWLGQLSIYAAYAAGGYLGMQVWLSLVAPAVFVVVFILCRSYSRNDFVAFLGGLLAWFFGTVGLSIRPQVPGHLFLALELLLLELGRTRDRRWLWSLPPLFAVWANVHGSYSFGLAVLLVYWVCSFVDGRWGLIRSDRWDTGRRRTLGLVLIGSAAALCCNPVGIHLLWYPFNMLFQQTTAVTSIDEWLPPDFRSARGMAMLLLLPGLLLVCLCRRRDLHLRELLLLLMAVFLAVEHVRMLFLFGIIASPIFCRILASEFANRGELRHPFANAALILVGLAAIAGTFPKEAAIKEEIRKAEPVAAVTYIRHAGLAGPMLNDYGFGGYLMWALPEHKVFIDGRADIYDWHGVMSEYGRWMTLSEDPQLLLRKYGIRLCLLPTNAPMTKVLSYLPGWRKAYSDDVAAVFVR